VLVTRVNATTVLNNIKLRLPSQTWLRIGLGIILVLIEVLGAVQVTSVTPCPAGCKVAAASAVQVIGPPPAPAVVTVTPAPDARDVDPLSRVLVTAVNGKLASVNMFNDGGKPIPGIMTPDLSSWKPAVPLGYGRTYTLAIFSLGPGNIAASQVSTFSTLTPRNQTEAYLNTTSGAALKDGGKYGIGTVVVAHFDEPITDRVAAERQLRVTTSPPVAGSWYWVDDQNAHWRPERFYAPGTVVTAEARLYGAQVGDGLYGQEDSRVSFTIGDSHVSIADDKTKQVSVYENGVLVRTMPTSMGMGGTEDIGGRTLSFWTPPGVYTVMDKGNPVVMDSSTFGLPINSRLGYRETIAYATRISTDGIYLHQLNATVWAQGNTDTSHGCLNLNGDNAKWFFNFSQPGDVVEIRNTGGAPLQVWQNGDWTVPWDQWLKGSAFAQK
jgi:lipoprotein-anchoring transpeptidase ErfK/SrfK